MAIVSLCEPEAVAWSTIDLGGGQSFEVGVRPPTFDELLADADRLLGTTAHRVKHHVVDWRGLEARAVITTDPANPVESSQPIPFSQAELARLCRSYPGAFAQIAAAVHRAFRRLGGPDAGK